MPTIVDRLQHAWNAFVGRDPTTIRNIGAGYSSRPDRMMHPRDNTRTIVNAIFNRIAIDAAAVEIREVIVDENQHFRRNAKDSSLTERMSLSANIDQTGRAFRQDIYMSMFNEGVIAVVPTHTDIDPESGSFRIDAMRVGKIVEWYPKHVKVDLYNETTGKHQEVTLPKKTTAIIENPFYSTMNEANSTLQRLVRVLNKLDVINEVNSSGKLDLIIQLPYAVKSDLRRQQAEERRLEIEKQLTGTKYGIAYTDGTEKITQLNRAIENNIWEQVKTYTEELYNQLGLTKEIFDGTADEAAMLNYNNRSLEPVISSVVDEFRRKFLTKTARTQGHDIRYFSDPFKLVPVNNLAEIADKFTRNEIMSSNEFRAVIGYMPVDDPRADELRNKNLNASDAQLENPIMANNSKDGDYTEEK